MTPSSLSGPPVSALVPPGKCQFTPEFAAVRLLERTPVSATSTAFRFACPDTTQPLNLSTCACILAKAVVTREDGTTEDVVRPYTPFSTNVQVGSFDLLVKHYEGGLLSGHLKKMEVGATLEFKHIPFNVKIQAPFKPKYIGMLVGGTGITPMIQALHAILGDSTSEAKVSMVYGSRVASDILGAEMLDKWAAEHSRLSLTHVLSHEPEDSDWKGERGHMTKELLVKHLPSPDLGDDVIVFVCGPPPMYTALCGPRDAKELTGILAEMGYSPEQVFKF